jgi:hypothetical protein
VIVDATGGLKLGTNADAGVTLTSYQGSTNSNVRTIDFNVQNFVVNTGSPTGTTVSEAFRVTNDGNVGIGTTSPSSRLDIVHNNNNPLRLQNSTGVIVKTQFEDNASRLAEIALNTGSITFSNGTSSVTERMRIDSSGNVITGSTTANASDAVTLRQDGTAHVNNVQVANGGVEQLHQFTLLLQEY